MSRNMAVLGKKGASYGLWISKPGKDVLTASIADMLLSMDHVQLQQVLKSGVITVAGNSISTISITGYGFVPVVEYNIVQQVGGEDCIKYPYLGPTVEYQGTTAYDYFVKVAQTTLSFHNEGPNSITFAYRVLTTEVTP